MTTYGRTNRGTYVALGLLFGVAAGVGAGVLTAPRSGAETRRRIRDKAAAAKQQARSRLQSAHSTAQENINAVVDGTAQAADVEADNIHEAAHKTSRRVKDVTAGIQGQE